MHAQHARFRAAVPAWAAALLLLLCPPVVASADAGAIDDARLAAADDEPGAWLAHGRTWSEQRYSPLTGLDAGNVAGLELRWSYDPKTERGLAATPIVVDGVLYTTATWSVVHAVDAKTGAGLWTFDPKVPKEVGLKACCDVVNRGVAV